jgi:hypothetical protein
MDTYLRTLAFLSNPALDRGDFVRKAGTQNLVWALARRLRNRCS